jgi:hypothetical protein
MMERADKLSQFHFTWPEFTPDVVLSILHWLMAIVALAGLLWLFSVLDRNRADRVERPQE